MSYACTLLAHCLGAGSMFIDRMLQAILVHWFRAAVQKSAMKRASMVGADCLEAGYEDYEQMKVDLDLEAVRTDPRFNNLMGNYNKGGGGGFFGTLLKGFQM